MRWCRFYTTLVIVLAASFAAYGQATVNVQPGDDIAAALDQAGPGGTVNFAPGWYDLKPAVVGTQYGIRLQAAHSGITLKGAGPGTDPATATILDGEAWFLASGFRIETFDVTIDGFTILHMWDEAFEPTAGAENVEIRNCWSLGCDSGADPDGTAGFGDETNFDDMVRYYNCIFARGGDDGTDTEGDSAILFQNCDFYDWDSDVMENVDNTIVIVQNTIYHGGSLSDDLVGGLLMEMRNCVFFDPKGSAVDGIGGMAPEAAAFEVDGVEGDPLYVNVGPNVHYLDLDFHLLPGSPALTAGKTSTGAVTFAGSQGPAQ